MGIEYEAKVLDVDIAATTALILAAGGRQVGGPSLQRRYVYDVVPDDRSRWLRLRDTGGEATLCVKESSSDGIDGTHEIETTVGDFAAAAELIGALGFVPRAYQENRRTSFVLGGARLELDEWPLIPPYLEIEADSRDDVVATAAWLGYSEDRLTGENTVAVYARHGIDLTTIADLRF